jgi:hypothetical protein
MEHNSKVMKIGNYCFGGIVEQCFLNQGQDAKVPRPKVILVAPCVDWREQSKLVLQHYYPTILEVHSRNSTVTGKTWLRMFRAKYLVLSWKDGDYLYLIFVTFSTFV